VATVSPSASSGNIVVDRALAAALADPAEKWLISKGRLDYGPFALADVVAQIEKGEIVAGNMIMDKDEGTRGSIGEHPLLGPLIDAARQRLDDQRRARAEAVEQRREKKTGALLYAVIGLGVTAAALAVFLVIRSTRRDESVKTTGINALAGASLKVKWSEPKVPPASHRSGRGHRPSGASHAAGEANASEDMALDLTDD